MAIAQPVAVVGPRLGIAFEGCGCRAAFHVGALEWLKQQGLAFTAVTGASSGSLIAGAAAIGRVADLRDASTELPRRAVFDLRSVCKGAGPSGCRRSSATSPNDTSARGCSGTR